MPFALPAPPADPALLPSWQQYLANLDELRRQLAARPELGFDIGPYHPCLADRSAPAGELDKHYFLQDIHAARLVLARRPPRHIDIGSRVDGFVAHLAVFMNVEVLDVRPLVSPDPAIIFRQADLTADDFDPGPGGPSLSVSCLHAIEHFGLGRYGDPIRADGHILAIANLARLTAPGGHLLLSTVIGKQRVHFDAHRVFAVPTLLALVAPHFTLARLDYIDDAGRLHTNADALGPAAATSFGCHYGCAILDLVRRA